MAESTADYEFEDFILEIVRARRQGQLSDAIAQDVCAGLNDPLPNLAPADDECDLLKVELIIRLARARGRKTLTAEPMQEIAARLARVSERPPPERRDSIGPELIYEQTAAEELLASEDDVMDVEDGETSTAEWELDTDPPPAGDKDG